MSSTQLLNLPTEVDQFSEKLIAEEGASKHTVSAYLSDIRHFFHYLSNHNNIPFLDVSKNDIQAYLIHLSQTAEVSERTQARRLSALRAFYTFLKLETKINENPTTLIERPKQPKTLPKYLTESEVLDLIRAAYSHPHPDEKLRRVLFIELLYATGLRISELINIKLSDIQWQDECILVSGKGHKQRLVPFNESTATALTNYISHLPKHVKWLFPSGKHGAKPLTRQRFFQIIKELAVDANIPPEKVSPHIIRHAFATHLINRGANLINLQKLLGHSSVSATEIYTHIMEQKLQDTVFNHHPLSDKKGRL